MSKKKNPMTKKDAERIIKKGKDDGFKKRGKSLIIKNTWITQLIPAGLMHLYQVIRCIG